MKNKMFLRLFLAAGVATILAACTSESENGPSANISYESIAATQQVPVTFSTYMGETPVTRAGYVGPIEDATTLQTSGVEFGVFGYYTNGGDYDSNSSTGSGINFMYNQKIEYKSSAWTYSPIKYWPNETSTDGNGATSTGGIDKLSFFAYAPYVTGSLGATGITTLPANTAKGDPKVNYVMSQTGLESVDLMWAVSNGADTTPEVDGSAGGWGIADGMPFIDLVKPQLKTTTATASPVKFNFKHALARLALNVQATRDTKAVVTSGGTEFYGEDAANKTKVMIETVTLSGKFPTSGVLNLNNFTGTANKPQWEISPYPTTNTNIIINEDNMTPSLLVVKDGSDNVESAANQKDGSTDYPGVLVNNSTPLLANDASTPRYFMFIPNTTTDASTKQDKITVNIVYHVITDDDALSGGKVVITNNITKIIDLNLESGKAYTLNLVLGMETVDITGTVTGWDDSVGTTPVDLPLNVAPDPAP